jgi:hypothetical protein
VGETRVARLRAAIASTDVAATSAAAARGAREEHLDAAKLHG